MVDYVYTCETQTELDADWTFTGPVAGDGVQAANTAGRWSYDTNETTSAGVGPYQGDSNEGTNAGYIYTEMSSQADGDVWTMTWDQNMDASANNYTFEFYWCARGADANPLIEVQTNENSAGWVTRLTTGSDGNGGDETVPTTTAAEVDTPWHLKSVDLSSLISDSVCQIRIRIQCDTTTTTTNFWHNDIGIDSILIVETVSSVPTETEGFRFRNDDGSESAATWRQSQDVDDTIGKEENFRLRVLVDNDGNPATAQVTLQYKRDDEAASEWRDV